MRYRALLLAVTLCVLAAPAAAHASGGWTCSASAGWLAAGGQRVDAPSVSGDPCPSTTSNALTASGPPGNLAASGSVALDGGSSSQTTDARQPHATVSAQSLAIHNADGKLVLTASNMSATAGAACDANRQPAFTSSGSPGAVTLNGHSVDTSKDYSEPGVGVNGAPLFGKITIYFNQVTRSATGITRSAIHVVVTDRNGGVVFEAVAGVVAAGSDGDVCAPPPVCPPGQQPQAGRCVDVAVTPLPAPPPPAPGLPAPIGGGGTPTPAPQRPTPRTTTGCRYADTRADQASPRRLAKSVLCLLNVARRQHHRRKLRLSKDLSRAATHHARDMVRRRYFSHTEPSGVNVVDRILHSGYLGRYGRWRIGENLAWGWGGGATPRSIVAAWMRSIPHRRNILNRGFHDIGIAVVLGSPRHRRPSGSVTYVLDFGGFQVTTRAR